MSGVQAELMRRRPARVPTLRSGFLQRFTPLLIDAARPCRHTPGAQWFIDETYVKVNTDCAPTYPPVLDEMLPAACHVMKQYANNPIEADHGRLKSWLRPMRGLKWLRSVRVVSTGPAFVQNLRQGHDELGTDVDPRHPLPAAFTGLVLTI